MNPLPSEQLAIEESINFIENYLKSIFERPVKETHPMIWKKYQEEIKNPMDIKTIKEKRDKKLYTSFDSVDADITLMYQNSIDYNSNPQHENRFLMKVSRTSLERWKKFRKRFVQTDDLAEYEADLDVNQSNDNELSNKKRKYNHEVNENQSVGVELSTRNLPPPTPIPEQAQVFMKGQYKSEDGFHKCKGYWAYKLEYHHNNNQDEMSHKGYISKFQFEIESQQEGPVNGDYHGYWMWKPKDFNERIRQIDKFFDLKFEPNSNTPNGYNVSGKGESHGTKKWGKFLISGTYDKGTGDMLLIRNYYQENNVINPKKKEKRLKLARELSSLINADSSSQGGGYLKVYKIANDSTKSMNRRKLRLSSSGSGRCRALGSDRGTPFKVNLNVGRCRGIGVGSGRGLVPYDDELFKNSMSSTRSCLDDTHIVKTISVLEDKEKRINNARLFFRI